MGAACEPCLCTHVAGGDGPPLHLLLPCCWVSHSWATTKLSVGVAATTLVTCLVAPSCAPSDYAACRNCNCCCLHDVLCCDVLHDAGHGSCLPDQCHSQRWCGSLLCVCDRHQLTGLGAVLRSAGPQADLPDLNRVVCSCHRRVYLCTEHPDDAGFQGPARNCS